MRNLIRKAVGLVVGSAMLVTAMYGYAIVNEVGEPMPIVLRWVLFVCGATLIGAVGFVIGANE
jgi:hypothetical protein